MAASGISGVIAAAAAIVIAGRGHIARKCHVDGHTVRLDSRQRHPRAQHDAEQANDDSA